EGCASPSLRGVFVFHGCQRLRVTHSSREISWYRVALPTETASACPASRFFLKKRQLAPPQMWKETTDLTFPKASKTEPWFFHLWDSKRRKFRSVDALKSISNYHPLCIRWMKLSLWAME